MVSGFGESPALFQRIRVSKKTSVGLLKVLARPERQTCISQITVYSVAPTAISSVEWLLVNLYSQLLGIYRAFIRNDPLQMHVHAKGRENGTNFPPKFMSKYMLIEKAYGLSGNVAFTLFFLIYFSIYSHNAKRNLLCFSHNHGGILGYNFLNIQYL
jgi:hypothetical protein